MLPPDGRKMAEEHLQNNAIGAAVRGGEAEAKAEEYEVTAQCTVQTRKSPGSLRGDS